MTCNCAEFEILLCDAVDGTLRGEQKAAFEAHRDSCRACGEMAADVLGVTAFIERAAVVEPPKELLTQILFQTSGAKPEKPAAAAGWLGRLRQFMAPVLQPRLAMGMAMTMLSISMLSQVFGLEIRPMRAADLEPARIWAGVEDGAHRQWSRVVKYYENIRVVYEIQSRLKEWADQEEQDRQNQQKDPAAAMPTKTVPTPVPGR
ncbi:MAG TPA: zf-HC2 domain-containing protein [Bryobacteraceae bacterium]|nr:zf-HC2 domain-containing protein [Bryobacteraceae bacterium]